MKNKWTIQPHSQYDKSFVIDGPLPLVIDNDDVWQPGVAILAEEVVRVLNNQFVSIYRMRCENEDCANAFDRLYLNDIDWCPTCGVALTEFEVFAS